MDMLDQIRTATGWSKVTETASGYLIRMSQQDVANHRVKGLVGADKHFYLEFESLRDIPIGFHITVGESIYQQWTLNQNLHRSHGLPAKMRTNSRTGTSVQEWYWNGLRHREDHPAIVEMENGDLKLSWCDQGQPRIEYGKPVWVKMSGYQKISMTNHRAAHVSIMYPNSATESGVDHPGRFMLSDYMDRVPMPPDRLWPGVLTMTNLVEHNYQIGCRVMDEEAPLDRSVDAISMTWYRNKKNYTVPELDVLLFKYHKELNFLDFWKNKDSLELVFLTEFDNHAEP